MRETKCGEEVMKDIGNIVWRGSEVMEIDAQENTGRLAIFWQAEEVCLTNF